MTFQRSALWIAGLCFSLCLLSCQQSNTSGADAPPISDFVPPDTLRPVVLPNLDDHPPEVRAQLEEQYALLQALQTDTTSAEHGETAGQLGGMLLTYQLYDAATPALSNAIYLMPSDFRWPYYMGRLYQSTGQYEQAVRHYRQTLTLQPDDIPTHVHLAEVYQAMGREGEAYPLLETALRLDSSLAAAHFLLGQMTDDPAEAVEHYQAVLRLQPTATVANYPLGLAYSELGQAQQSQTYLARRGEGKVQLEDPLIRAIELQQKGVGTKLNRGSRFMAEGRFREAAIVFSEVIAEDSTEVTGYLNLGVALMQLGDWQHGLSALEQAARIDPTNSKVNYNLGLILAQLQDPRATEHLQTAIASDPENVQAHLTLGRLLWLKGQCADALPHFATYLQATPDAVDIRITAAMCQTQLGNEAAALALLEAGHKTQPTHPGLQDALVRILSASEDAEVRDGERAVEIAQNLVTSTRRPETLASLAMALAETDRFPEAIERQQEALQMAQQGNLSSLIPLLQNDLERYRRGQACRTPWPDFMFPKPVS